MVTGCPRHLEGAKISQGPEILLHNCGCLWSLHLLLGPLSGKESVTPSHVILPQSISSTVLLSNLCQEENSLESPGEKWGSVVSLKAGTFHHLPTDNTSNAATNGTQTRAQRIGHTLRTWSWACSSNWVLYAFFSTMFGAFSYKPRWRLQKEAVS